MPNMDGTDLILKAQEVQPETRFLIYTGSTEFVIPQSLIELGMRESDIYKKPVDDMGILVNALFDLLKR